MPVSGEIGSGSASVWAELLSPNNAETQVLVRYGASNGWLDGQPAVITRQVGKGSITYVGAWLDDALMSKLTASWIQMSQIQPILPNVPEGVEVCRRSGNGKSVVIVINHTATSQSIPLAHAMKDLLTDYTGPVSQFVMSAHGVAVLEETTR